MAGGEEAQTSSSQAQRGGRGDRGGSRGQRRGRPGRGRGQRQPQGSNATERPANAAAQPDGTSQQTETGGESSRRKRNPRNRRGGGQKQSTRGAHGPPVPGGNRAFGGRLTTEDDDAASESAGPSTALSLSGDAPEFVPGQPVNARQKPEARPRPQNREKPPKSTAQDLGTRIHEDISSRNYECAICTDDVTRSSQTWSCSLCWTVVHLKCVKRWYENQKKQKKELQSGQPQQDLSWRCPGCNSQLVDDPGSYHCWCGKDINPRPASGALPPHSCGQTCFKPRPTCPHPCSLQCHAGPCPPCDLMGPEQPCFCGKNGSQKRCRETDYENGWSCQEICGDLLPCGEHFCSKPCHSGLCGDCSVPVESRCFCGQVEKELSCFEREDPQDSYDAEKKLWFEASFTCGRTCARKFDCEFHSCSESCHAQDELPAHCPYSPDVVSHCPCGKTPLEKILSEPRQSCRDVVPHCDELCGKKLKCGHACQAKCHVGDCGGCDEYIDITCRCGRTTSNSMCHQGQLERPWCMRICQAKLSCGRHTCGEHCCSGEKTAAERQAAKRKHKAPSEVLTVEAEHICIKTCGRPLKCGSHNCQQMCHRGPCGSCPEAIFHEISCDCGRTILQPPQPCGTLAPDCRFPCTRRPGCGHPPVEHSCHSDDITCPKCPFLVDKLCACGKERLHSQPCHLQEPRCGRPCGKKLKCGLHNCKKLCHRQGECEAEGSASKHCGQTCGKKKMFCDHACQNTCHGQTPCNESAPCPAKATVTCPCGLNKQEVKCQASSSNPTPARPELKCDDECLRQERNRRLATALNIDPNTHQDDHVPYADTTLRLFQDHTSWAESQEREFRVFASSAKEGVLRYKPMPSHQRQFLHALAEDYGLESASEDVEPYRYVVVYKSPRFVSAPGKTLAQCVKIRAAQAASAAASSSAASSKPHTPAPAKSPDPYNALLLTSPRFGLTIEEVHQALDAAFASQPSLHLKIDFLPTDEVAVRAAAQYSALVDPGATEEALAALKPRVAEAAAASKLAAKVMLCHVGADQAVTRREDFARPDAGGWSAVAGRAASRREAPGADPSSSSLAGDAAPAKGAGKKKVLLGLRRKKPAEGGGGASGWASKLDGDVEC